MGAIVEKSVRGDYPARQKQHGLQPFKLSDPYFGNNASGDFGLSREASCACGGGCMKCLQGDNVQVQAKLKISKPGDQFEKEADAVADQVMQTSDENIVQRECNDCGESEKLQRKPFLTISQRNESSAATVTSDVISNKINSSRGNGDRMDGRTLSFMQSRIGADFRNVKIHTGGEAVQMNRELNAKAFTVGNDIYFNEGEYNPESNDGKHLLAHELVHSKQQGREKNSQVQRKIEVNPGLNLDTQGFTTTKSGDVYTCPAVVKGGLWNEIFTSLLHSPRVFKVAGSTEKALNENFLKHMKARYGVVQFASKKQYIFPKKATGELMNPAYWEHDATGWHEKSGVDRETAVKDLNVHPKDYEIGCLLATKLTMEGGSKSAVLRRETGAAIDDWIPGDWGYIKNTNFSGGYGLSGENIIYTGKDLFWGHFGPGNTYKSLDDWFADVESWDGGAIINTHRDHTDAGLE